jgi:hypothetical protein
MHSELTIITTWASESNHTLLTLVVKILQAGSIDAVPDLATGSANSPGVSPDHVDVVLNLVEARRIPWHCIKSSWFPPDPGSVTRAVSVVDGIGGADAVGADGYM